MDTFTSVQNPNDITYRFNRSRLVKELTKLSVAELDQMIQYQMRQPAPTDENGTVTKSIMGEMYNAPYTPASLKGILDSTNGTTGK